MKNDAFMKKNLSIALAILFGSTLAQASMHLTRFGKANATVILQPGATPSEAWAARDLTNALWRITGVPFELLVDQARAPDKAIVVGQGSAASALCPDVAFDQLGGEEILIRTKGESLVLAGGRPRGTLYAVSRFLQDSCGVRWWAPWASDFPVNFQLELPDLNVRERPAFESRDPFWFHAFSPEWAARNRSNSQHARLGGELGGGIQYEGFVHTFYPMVPPEKYFKDHPEWYSLIKGERTFKNAQLCLSNPKLREFVAEQVKELLRKNPAADIVSVSQNDWHGQCLCPECKAVDDAEGSPAGSMIQFANDIAQRIEKEFPHVAIDTLAYQYTRKAPKNVRPRPNVIVRLCSIECNFAAPLTDPSNASFAKDIADWAKICDRLYVWDYVTDFAHYIQPHPNWFSLGPNVRFFHENHVRGLFEQGAYQSTGAEMAELRAWVLARLLWNPSLNDQALIDEFLRGYYGAPAAKFIREYLNFMAESAKGSSVGCFAPTTTPFLAFPTLAKAEGLWREAEQAAKNDPDKLWRVRIGHLPLQYVWLSQWTQLRDQCKKAGAEWPVEASRKKLAEEWLQRCIGPGPKGWTKITHLNESGLTPETFVARFANDPE
jgi:hypothetical protein